MKHCVIFDLDGTLYDFGTAAAAALDGASAFVERELGIPAEEARADYTRLLRQQLDEAPDSAGSHSRLIRYQRMLEERALPLRYAEPIANAYWEAFFGAAKVYPDAAPALDALRAKGLRIGLGTNMTADWQHRKMVRFGLIDRFDFFVTSEEAAAEKPSPRFFAMCERKARCPAAECLFVGDNLELDVRGALRAGMDAAWLQPDAEKRAAHPDVRSVASLSELVPLLAP